MGRASFVSRNYSGDVRSRARSAAVTPRHATWAHYEHANLDNYPLAKRD